MAVLDPLVYHNLKLVSVRKNDFVFKVLFVNADTGFKFKMVKPK